MGFDLNKGDLTDAMGIALEESTRQRRNGLLPEEVQREKVLNMPTMVMSIPELERIVHDFAERECMGAEEKATLKPGSRTYRTVWDVNIEPYISHVTSGQFYRMLVATASAKQKAQALRQYNGHWQLTGCIVKPYKKRYLEGRLISQDLDGRKNAAKVARFRTHFMILLEYTDVRNATPLRFDKDSNPLDGDPVVHSSLDPKLQELLLASLMARLEGDHNDDQSAAAAERARREEAESKLAEATRIASAARADAEAARSELADLQGMMKLILENQKRMMEEGPQATGTVAHLKAEYEEGQEPPAEAATPDSLEAELEQETPPPAPKPRTRRTRKK
jgi:hypothetical protein